MKKLVFTVGMAFILLTQTNAQNFKETFDANSLEWTECAFESNNGTAVIDGGKMTIV